MKNHNRIRRSPILGFIALLLCGVTLSPASLAIEFDEVRNFDEVFVISATAPSRDRIEVSWAIEKNYYLYNNRFLRFGVDTEGISLGEPGIPRGEISFDELLGEEVEKYHEKLVVELPLSAVAPGIDEVELRVRSQGCLENELCYPPTEQRVTVQLPPNGGADQSGILAPDASPATVFPGLGSNGAGVNGSAGAALAPEVAFRYEAIAFDSGTILARFTAQPGYYLYRDKFEFDIVSPAPFTISGADLPAGTIKDDPEFGPVEVYYGQIEVPVRINHPGGPVTTVTLEAAFQGCRDGDICYPPMSRAVTLEMPANAAAGSDTAAAGDDASGRPAPVSEQDRLAGLLTTRPLGAIAAFFFAGLLLAFTPCVFPMLPILSGIIIGQGQSLTTARAFWLSLVYVLAMSLTYTVAGVLAGLFGKNLQAMFQNPWIISGFVLIFVLLALSMFGFYELQLPSRFQTRLAQASNRQKSGALWGVGAMGFLSALIVGPCVAPPLMAALIVIGSSGDAVLGGAALFALSMGMGVPLILFGVSAGRFLPQAGAWMNAVKAVFGVGLLALSIWMLERILPGAIIMLLWGALAIACGIYLGALERLDTESSGWRRLWKALGVVLLVLGIIEMVGAASGGDYWLRPLEGLRARAGDAPGAEHHAFERIKSLEDLERAVSRANAEDHGLMLDFYADWCVECKRMERNTFPDPSVQALLGRLDLVQADVTANDVTDQQLMQAFGIIGPPAILFFDRSGLEMRAARLVGYFEPEEFVLHLQRVLNSQ